MLGLITAVLTKRLGYESVASTAPETSLQMGAEVKFEPVLDEVEGLVILKVVEVRILSGAIEKPC